MNRQRDPDARVNDWRSPVRLTAGRDGIGASVVADASTRHDRRRRIRCRALFSSKRTGASLRPRPDGNAAITVASPVRRSGADAANRSHPS